MAMHSSILPWEIPWTEEPGGLQSMDTDTDSVTKQQQSHLCNKYTQALVQQKIILNLSIPTYVAKD